MAYGRKAAFLSAPILGLAAVLLLPGLGGVLLFSSFSICLGWGWVVVYENKAFLPGWRGALTRFDPTTKTKRSFARTAFFVSAFFVFGVCAGLLYLMVKVA